MFKQKNSFIRMFQFLMVQLKVTNGKSAKVLVTMFQFLMVQLKAKLKGKSFSMIPVSIPNGSTKRIGANDDFSCE